MKSIVTFVFALVVTGAAQAETLNLECSNKKSPEKMEVSGKWQPGVSFTEVTLSIVEAANVAPAVTQFKDAPLKAYNPRSEAYKGLNRFELQSAGWSTTSILLPMTKPKTGEFVGYYYDQGEGGSGTFRLICTVKAN